MGSRIGTMLATATVFFSALASVHAVRFPIARQMKREPSGEFGNNTVAVSNFGNALYMTNVTIGGVPFEIQIDTGSSALLIIGDVPAANTTNVNDTLAFGGGNVPGNLSFADLDFDGFHIPDQAFILANPTDAPSSFEGLDGILGLGPSIAADTRALINSSAGDPPLDRIFRQNMSTPNILTVLLSRASDTDVFAEARSPQNSLLSIGEVLEGFESIAYTPKLYAAIDLLGSSHWQTTLDSNGIIGPDGQRINTPTSASNVTIGNFTDTTVGGKDQFRVVFDTGFTVPQLPPPVVDAIYGRIPGVTNFTQNGQFFYNFSCQYELNVTFLFAGVEFPIHPLDLSAPGDVDSEGKPTWCASGFGPTIGNVAGNSGFGAFDAILGDGFLRNAYLLIDFGDFVDGSNSSVKNPYIQLLPTTDKTTAHRDFVNARLGGVDTTSSQPAFLPVSQESHSADGNSTASGADENLAAISEDDDSDDHFYQQTWFIVMVSVMGGLLAVGLAALLLSCFRRRRSNVRSEVAFVPPMVGEGSYRPLMVERHGAGPRDSEIFHAKYDEPSYEHGRYNDV